MNFLNRSKLFVGDQPSKKRPEGKSRFRRINDWLHLWLGLISGIIVFIVCLTGCIWVFNEEILWLLEPETRVEVQQKPVILPVTVQQIAEKALPGQKVTYANYQQGQAINVGAGDWDTTHYLLKLHPYTGQILAKETHQKDQFEFFDWILRGHRFLWLPWEIGRPIVNYATLVFVVLLITGLIWWYPKKWTKTTVEKSFTIKWGASLKRINLDLHNVLGFYSLLFLLAIALTGMVWGIEWYSKGLYWATSGGKTLADYEDAYSDSTKVNKAQTADVVMNLAWEKVIRENPEAKGFYYSFPDMADAKSAIYITIYPTKGQFYNNKSYTFDRHALQQLPEHEVYGADYDTASFGTKLRKMNYDIHVGSILGFPGKVLAFLASLIGASLPVTGFIVWWIRKGYGKKKNQPTKMKVKDLVENKVSTAKQPVFRPKVQKSTP